MASLKLPVILIGLLCAFAMVNTVAAVAGDRPLTQLAVQDYYWEYPTTVTASRTLTGATSIADGTIFVTTNDAILRIPISLTSATGPTAIYNVESGRITGANPRDQFAPCVVSPGTLAVPPCAAGFAYAGTGNTLYFKTTDYGTGLSSPFVVGSGANAKVYAFSSAPSGNVANAGLLIFDAATLGHPSPAYNNIVSPVLRGTIKVIQNAATSTVYFVTSGSGSASIVRASYSDLTTSGVANWETITFSGSSIADAHLSANGNTIVMVGSTTSGTTTTNIVWSTSATAAWTGAVAAPASPTTLDGTLCPDGPTTVIHDTAPGTNAVTVVVGCSGAAILTYDSALAFVNSTRLDSFDEFKTWTYDPSSGIIYAPLTASPGSEDFTNLLQYSIFGNLKEGRIESNTSLAGSAIVLTPRLVPDSAPRARAPFFYVVGSNPISQLPGIARWEAAQGCKDNCGENSSPQRGTCSRRTCTCGDYADPASGETLNYQLPWCATLSCPFDCNGKGQCSNGTCICDRIWKTTSPDQPCQTRQCPNDCLNSRGHGSCTTNSTGDLVCQCNAGWGGDDCSQKAKFPCNYLTGNCTACVDNPACVWCASARTCVYGTVEGPTADLSEFECRSWFHGECPSVGINIMNYIMTAIVGIVLIISLVSGALNDTADEIPERRTEWYLFQRANKLWSMVYQLQLIAIAGLINYPFATNFSAFVRYWNWILLAWGFPWHHSKNSQDAWYDSVSKTGRTTNNWEQYETYWKSKDNNMFFTFLLWWGVALGVFVVFYVILLVISMIRRGRTGFLATTRPFYVLLRALEFGHLGVCVMGPLSLVASKGASAIVGGILWVVLGLLVPVGLFIWLGFIKDKKSLFKPTFAASCYPYYGAYDFRYRSFIVAPWVKRILIGLFVGFIAKSNALGQLIAIAIVHLLYLAFVIIQRNMFSDYLQRYLEIILAILNLISFLFLFGFHGTPSGNLASTMGIIFLVLQFLAVTVSAAFFIISWLQLNQVYSLSQCIKFCTCRGEK